MTWGKISAGECVENPCPRFQCSTCATLDCYVDYCSEHTPRAYCEGYVACAEANVPPHVDGRPVCVRDPCERFTCSCPLIDPLCFGPDVGYCSEFMVDWHHCAGQLACVQASWMNVRTMPICVADPCPPRLSTCFACDSNVCDPRCSETVSLNYGWVDCDGRRVIDWYCVINCPPNVGPVECYQDLSPRVECTTTP